MGNLQVTVIGAGTGGLALAHGLRAGGVPVRVFERDHNLTEGATSRVTLLGDALHNMTPFRGIGANTAFRDAVILRDALVRVHKGERDVLAALADYEREMIGYGFDAVRASLANMKRLHARSPISRLATKAFFRLADWSPWLLKRVIDTGG